MQETPALKDMTNLEIDGFLLKKLIMEHPCYTSNQTVEHHIKLVTEASASVVGFERRDGVIRQKIQSRKLMRYFNTKKQFDA